MLIGQLGIRVDIDKPSSQGVQIAATVKNNLQIDCKWVMYFHLVELRFAAGRLRKLTCFILFAVVPDHMKSLTNPLVPDEQCNKTIFLEILTFSHRTEKKMSSFCISKLEGDFGSY